MNRIGRVAAKALIVAMGSCVTAACASRAPAPQPFPMPPRATASTPVPAPPLPASVGESASAPVLATPTPAPRGADALALVGTALGLRGIPYRNGGSSLEGFDCSGFTQFVYARYGMLLPREVRDQFQIGQRVRKDDISAGDLVFFSTTTPGASHVGIALGGDQFVHAPSTSGVVRVERISSRYWAGRFVGARRIERH